MNKLKLKALNDAVKEEIKYLEEQLDNTIKKINTLLNEIEERIEDD